MNFLLLSLILFFNILTTLRYQSKLNKNKYPDATILFYILYLFEVIIIDYIVYNVYYALKG